MSKYDATQKYTIRDYRNDLYGDGIERITEPVAIMYPKPIEPDKPKFDGIHTIGTLKGLTKTQIEKL